MFKDKMMQKSNSLHTQINDLFSGIIILMPPAIGMPHAQSF